MRILWIAMLACLVGCTDESSARNALQDEGFTDIRFTGYDWFACSKDDFTHTGFVAKGPTGRESHGVVCCGMLFKACTVRFGR
jgi:hypothetical protein